MEMKQGIFNDFHRYFLDHPEEYAIFEARLIVKWYCVDKLSCGEIIEILKGYPRRIAQVAQLKKIILDFDKTLWRDQQEACNTHRAISKKKDAWRNSLSGYNQGDKSKYARKQSKKGASHE